MAAMDQIRRSNKRKRPDPSKPLAKESKDPQRRIKPSLPNKSSALPLKEEPKSMKERRLIAKGMVEAKKMKRKPNYKLEKELASLWEKMRCCNIGKDERSKLVSQALQKMTGKLLEIANSHVTARVLQICVKYCSQGERDIVFGALQPHLLTLSRKEYAVYLVKKVLDSATKKQLDEFFSSLHGHVASLLRHSVGSAVIEHAFHLGKGYQKQSLLMEMYSTELQLFRDLTLSNKGRLVDIISKLGLQKSSVLQYMTSVIQPILEKGIVDYSIIHTVLMEYFSIADKSSAMDVIQQFVPLLVRESASDSQQPSDPHFSRKRKNKNNKFLAPLLVRMMRSRDGLKLGILCIKHGSAKERKKIIKGIKGHITKLALDPCGSLLLVCILSVIDDTKLLSKIVIHELLKSLKELVLDKNGRRPILQLLHPLCARYLAPDDLACLNVSVPSLCAQGEGVNAITEAVSNSHSETDTATMTDNYSSEISTKIVHLEVGGKKDPSLRRSELLVDSQLAEALIETCIGNVGELLRSNFGKDVIYEVAVGGADGVLQSLADRLNALHVAIASHGSEEKKEEEEHVLENFHSSRIIRKLVLESSTFASTFWKMAMQGKCEMWAHGHSSKVVAAFFESSNSMVRDLAKLELQPLIDRGALKIPERNSRVTKH